MRVALFVRFVTKCVCSLARLVLSVRHCHARTCQGFVRAVDQGRIQTK